MAACVGLREQLLLVLEERELLGNGGGAGGGGGDVGQALESVGLGAECLRLLLSDVFVCLEREVGGAKDEGYAAGLLGV